MPRHWERDLQNVDLWKEARKSVRTRDGLRSRSREIHTQAVNASAAQLFVVRSRYLSVFRRGSPGIDDCEMTKTRIGKNTNSRAQGGGLTPDRASAAAMSPAAIRQRAVENGTERRGIAFLRRSRRWPDCDARSSGSGERRRGVLNAVKPARSVDIYRSVRSGKHGHVLDAIAKKRRTGRGLGSETAKTRY